MKILVSRQFYLLFINSLYNTKPFLDIKNFQNVYVKPLYYVILYTTVHDRGVVDFQFHRKSENFFTKENNPLCNIRHAE